MHKHINTHKTQWQTLHTHINTLNCKPKCTYTNTHTTSHIYLFKKTLGQPKLNNTSTHLYICTLRHTHTHTHNLDTYTCKHTHSHTFK